MQSLARHMILSSGDAETVRLPADGLVGLRIGYDPCQQRAFDRLQLSRGFACFVRDAVAASPKAVMLYLACPPVLEADRAGFDIVGAFS